MPTIIATDDLSDCLDDLSPTHVAVAFMGRAGARYLNLALLERVIISPGLGTNPAAVVELAESIGWERVLLLEALHSKLYCAAHAALIGSANLSRQALEPGGQQELCVLLDDTDSVRTARDLFDGYAREAEQECPTTRDKLALLHKLRRQRRRAEVYDVSLSDDPPPVDAVDRFGDYNVDRDGEVFCAWVMSDETEYTENVPEEVRSAIADEIHLAPDDLDPEQEWFLYYHVHGNDPGLHLGRRPVLLYVHRLFEDGCTDEGYEKLGVQMSDLRLPKPPFDVEDHCFVQAFREVMSRDEFAVLRGAAADDPGEFAEDTWRFNDHRELNRRFLGELKRVYKQRC
ncbi:phospholipase D family protein [Thiohalocapsa sp. ML1]|jgi:hypothetical protein|uniref:phospholipase D family protein n=1 Tax=Thiohalocapsa sp. ML1 TaxID=1431688 RepID=UPI000732355E|nr:phospholipase D family protein [Thiohalocapsa sp. ML1]